jgi:phosphatidylinositol glycan class N
VDGFTAHRLILLAILAVCVALTLSTDYSLRRKEGLPRLNQIVSWLSFFGAPFLGAFSARTPYKRFLSIFLALASPMCLLSVNYELLFYAILGLTLLQWFRIERCIFYRGANDSKSQGHDGDQVNMGDIRSAFIFLSMVHIAFFGTGNIASMSSFHLSATYRFITVFNPFLMGALCIIAKLIPYVLVTSMVLILAGERWANKASTVSPIRLFFLVIIMYDALAMSLFFYVKDEGSWLEIGNSISQFGLANAQCIFLPMIFALSKVLLNGTNMKSTVKNN